MAGGKPFNVGAQPARTNPGASGQVQRKPYNPAETAKHAQADDVSLVEAGQEHRQPDGDVGGAPEQDSEDGARPFHEPANPWPAAKPVAKKPFKL